VSRLHELAAGALRRVEPEAAHRATLWALGHGLGPVERGPDEACLATRLWGSDFPNPLGLAAGFDKNAVAVEAALKLRFGFTEVGGVTPRPQAGNPRPRLFRLDEDGAAINRMGFNNDGMTAVAERLARARRSRPVGVNLASNTDSADPAADFAALVARFAPLADFLTVDVSCPNTANGKVFLEPGRLRALLTQLRELCPRGPAAPALLVKLAPDVDASLLARLVEAAIDGVDGLIVSNTTLARPAGLKSRHAAEAGGLSGRPLFAPSTALLRDVARLSGGQVPLIGVGGVASGADAYAKIRAGAALVQLYTALVFQGPALVPRIKRELAALLRRDGFATVADAVGADLTAAAA